MKKTQKLHNLRKKLAQLNAEVEGVQAQIDELLNDPEVVQAEAKRECQAQERIEGFPSLCYSDERMFYRAGFRTFQDVLAWIDNPLEKKTGIGEKRIENFRRDMKRYLRWDDESSYERELNEGKHPILAGMCAYFKDPSKRHGEYSHGTFTRITSNYDPNPEWIEVCEIIFDHSKRYPNDRKDGAIYCIPFKWVTELHLYDALETVLPLNSYDEHEWLRPEVVERWLA